MTARRRPVTPAAALPVLACRALDWLHCHRGEHTAAEVACGIGCSPGQALTALAVISAADVRSRKLPRGPLLWQAAAHVEERKAS